MNLRLSSVLCCAALLTCAGQTFAQSEPAGGGAAPGPAAAPTDPGAGHGADAGKAKPLAPLIEVQPIYPAAALGSGRRGYVELQFTVNEEGRVRSASVVKSEPGKLFDAAALAAVGKWRFPAQSGREPVKLTHRFDFAPPLGGGAGAPAGPSSVAEADFEDAASGAARNDCVHEGSVFDYGNVVQVGLESNCRAPLMVFACAGGTGGRRGRWACTDSERQQHVIVPPGDARLGKSVTVTTPNGTRSLTYADQFIVPRAPNSEYWWLACGASDGQCRGAGRIWIRSVDGQLSSVDPRGRTALEPARSH